MLLPSAKQQREESNADVEEQTEEEGGNRNIFQESNSENERETEEYRTSNVGNSVNDIESEVNDNDSTETVTTATAYVHKEGGERVEEEANKPHKGADNEDDQKEVANDNHTETTCIVVDEKVVGRTTFLQLLMRDAPLLAASLVTAAACSVCLSGVILFALTVILSFFFPNHYYNHHSNSCNIIINVPLTSSR